METTTIMLSKEARNKLKELKINGESYDSVIIRLANKELFLNQELPILPNAEISPVIIPEVAIWTS